MRGGGTEKWKAAARGLGLPIAAERIERIAPILDDLAARGRAALDEDLSLVEPAGTFRPAGNARATAAAGRSKANADRCAAPRNGSSD